jgi:hypothetical protein
LAIVAAPEEEEMVKGLFTRTVHGEMRVGGSHEVEPENTPGERLYW